VNRRAALKCLAAMTTALVCPSPEAPAASALRGAQGRHQDGDSMNSSDFKPAFATAAETANAVRNKRVSATELLNLEFQRIDSYNPRLNAIVWQDREKALACAKQADASLAEGKSAGALHGVPVTIKESFAYRGSPNTWGLPALKNAISPRTAVAIQRLESAGATVLGKTNVSTMLADWQSYNPIYGASNNPWDLALTPGGSTGGGAAALAAGLGCLTVGSDLMGSVRIPAHFCGVYAHKPSLGLVSTAGFQPGPWDGSPGYPMDLSVMGPLARSAADLALSLSVLGGANGEEVNAWTWRLPAPRHTRLRDFRVGYVFDDPASPLASDVRSVYENALSTLSGSGAKTDRGWPAGVDAHAHMKTLMYLLFALVTAEMPDDARQSLRQRLQGNPEDVFAAAAAAPHARWLHQTQDRLVYRALWQKYFDTHDVFLMPTTFTAAFRHDHSEPLEARVIATAAGQRSYAQDLPFWIRFATLAGLPATVAPAGRTSAGLPVGMQIIGPMWEDATPIEFAARLSEVVGGFESPPGYQA
jgi:amidase